jgi:energy-coupling factor transporter ATP-binding protein EcfA2
MAVVNPLCSKYSPACRAQESGEVELAGKVGYVFQNPDHQLVMPTVGADVAFGLVDENLSYLNTQLRVERAPARCWPR